MTDVAKLLTITATGGSIDGDITGQYCNDYARSYSFPVYDYSSDVTIVVEIDGESDCFVLPFAEITSVEARMHQVDGDPKVTEANYDQDVFFKAIATVDPLPGDLTYDSISWSGAEIIAGTPWAKRTTDNNPGRPFIFAGLGNTSKQCLLCMVRLTLDSWICGGTSFREIKMDPPVEPVGTVYGGRSPKLVGGVIVDQQMSHWAIQRDAYPVLYKVGKNLNLKPKFTVEPSDFNGLIYTRASGRYNFDEKSKGSTPGKDFEADAQDANTPLPSDVGEEKGSLTWSYRVGESAITGAGMGDYDVYLSFSDAETSYITVVDTACNGGGGSANPAVIAGIWGKFGSLGVNKYQGAGMQFWGGDLSTSENFTVEDLIKDQDGRCQAWQEFFIACLKLHQITATAVMVSPANQLKSYPAGWTSSATPTFKEWTGDGLYVNRMAAQSKTVPIGFDGSGLYFNGHAIVQIGNALYDPLYGNKFDTYPTEVANRIAWEDLSLDKLVYIENDDPIPPQTQKQEAYPANRPGVEDTNIPSITLPL